MKRMFDDEEEDFEGFDKAKIIVSIIPVVLIVLILAVMLLVDHGKKKETKGAEEVQQSILDYAAGEEEKTVQTDAEAALTVKETREDKEAEQEETASPAPKPLESPTPYREVMQETKVDYSKIQFDKEAQLKEMMAYWADSNEKAVDELAGLDRFRAMSWKLKGTTDCYYYGEVNAGGQAHGTGIAVYADNQYYYGSWENGVRSGSGTWVHYHVHNGQNKTDLYTYHQYSGMWKNDLPEGEGSEHYDFNLGALKEHTQYTSNRLGSYTKGLINGEFYLTSIDIDDDSMMEWEGEAKEGSWLYQADAKDKKGNRPVLVDYNDPNNYTWMQPKENTGIGIPCLISVNKN